MEQVTLEQKDNDETQYVVFKLGTEKYGLFINIVKEIIVSHDATQLPGFTAEVEGIINLRGSIVPVYNLRKKFGLPQTEHLRSSRIIVVEVQGCTVGITVDGVSEVLRIPSNVIEKPSSMITSGVDINYINGIAKMEKELVILLDIDKVISQGITQAV